MICFSINYDLRCFSSVQFRGNLCFPYAFETFTRFPSVLPHLFSFLVSTFLLKDEFISTLNEPTDSNVELCNRKNRTIFAFYFEHTGFFGGLFFKCEILSVTSLFIWRIRCPVWVSTDIFVQCLDDSFIHDNEPLHTTRIVLVSLYKMKGDLGSWRGFFGHKMLISLNVMSSFCQCSLIMRNTLGFFPSTRDALYLHAALCML